MTTALHQVDTVEQAAAALRSPRRFRFATLLPSGSQEPVSWPFPVLSGSLSYIFCETFGWENGMDKKFSEAKPFYLIISVSLILGLSLNYIGITPIQGLILLGRIIRTHGASIDWHHPRISVIIKSHGEFTNGRSCRTCSALPPDIYGGCHYC